MALKTPKNLSKKNLEDKLRKRLNKHGLEEKVDWGKSQFADTRLRNCRNLSNAQTLRATLQVSDHAWMAVVREIVTECCSQLEQKFCPVTIECVFPSGWLLGELRPSEKPDYTYGIPLCPGARYLASLRWGDAQVSAVIDVEASVGAPEVTEEDVRDFVEDRLSGSHVRRWDPEKEPLLMADGEVVKYYANRNA
jgi:hypothetical protein